MAYANFKQTIWSKKIQQELTKLTVLQEDCNTQFQGEAKMGETVKILGAVAPSVKTYVPGTNIDAAETPDATSIELKINQYNYTHFLVDDVDEAQSVEGMMEALMKASSGELAEARDSYIAGLAKDFAAEGQVSASTAVTDAAGAKAAVDAAFVKLWDNGVRINAGVSIVMTPWFYTLFKDKLTELSTDNLDLIKKGIVGLYNGATVKLSNNLYNDGTDDCMLIRTKDAIAFAGGIHKVEPYRPEGQFSDAIKVLDTFGAKIVRPKELYIIKAHKGA